MEQSRKLDKARIIALFHFFYFLPIGSDNLELFLKTIDISLELCSAFDDCSQSSNAPL